MLTGLTEISDVNGHRDVDGKSVPIEGELYYQGYKITDLVEGFRNHRFNFEEVTYLLLFGELPNRKQLRDSSIFWDSPRTSEQVCPGCHHESTECEYHERDAALRSDAVFLRFGSGRYHYSERPRQSMLLIGVMPMLQSIIIMRTSITTTTGP